MMDPQPRSPEPSRGRGYARGMRQRAIARAMRVFDGEPVRCAGRYAKTRRCRYFWVHESKVARFFWRRLRRRKENAAVRGVDPQEVDVVGMPHTQGWLTW